VLCSYVAGKMSRYQQGDCLSLVIEFFDRNLKQKCLFSQYRIVHHLSNVSLEERWLGRQLTSWVLAYFILSASVVDT
jgi:streptomycin 6-kinase